MGITKNHQSSEKLEAMAAAAFPGRQVSTVQELTEGMFNAAYRLTFADGRTAVLKIASGSQEGLLSNEINLMRAEVDAMQLLRDHGLPYVPEVYYADFSKTLCDGTFFFMEDMPGQSINSCREKLSQPVMDNLMRETGAFQRRMMELHGSGFGLLGDEERFSSLHDMLCCMFRRVLGDAQRRNIPLTMNAQDLMALLMRDKAAFASVTTPTLVHWDMWEGNIFQQDNKLSGIIDWERAMWGECFMDDRFRRHTRSQAFLEGFGHTVFTPEETRRIRWYDLFLYITMYVESFYRQYDPDEGFNCWIHQEIDMAWSDLQKRYEGE